MKKRIWLAGILIFSLFFTACGAKETGGDTPGSQAAGAEGSADGDASGQAGAMSEDMKAMLERTEYYDITLKQEEIFDMGLWEKNSHEEYEYRVISQGGTVYLPMGTQFYQGEPVQFWAELSSGRADLCLYRRDGSRQLMLEDMGGYTTTSRKHQWYMDREGNFFCSWEGAGSADGVYTSQGHFVKILSSGEALEPVELEPGMVVKKFCQTEDGRTYVLLMHVLEVALYLEEVDSATGNRIPESRIEVPMNHATQIGSAGNRLILAGDYKDEWSSKIVELNPSDGSLSEIQDFSGTSYELRGGDLDLSDCQILEDGSVELLWTQRHRVANGTGGILEHLKMEQIEKTPIVMRGVFSNDSWLTDKISLYNMKSDTYQVVRENCSDGQDTEDFFRLTNVQIGAGKGPDILCGSGMPQGFISGLLEKGALEDLAPYLASSGIRQEEYLPMTFATWRQGEKIYGVKYRMDMEGERVRSEVLGAEDALNIESLADGLLALEEDGIYYEGWDSKDVLNSFFKGTDSLWGMVDWEKGSCDFNTPLFGKLLEAARRHGDDGRKKPEFIIMDSRDFFGFVYFRYQEEQEEGNSVVSGTLFDEGCYAAITSSDTLAINANSPNKEGAWDFIRFLISEENQETDIWYHIPVNRNAFEEWVQWDIETLGKVRYENGVRIRGIYNDTDTSEERQAEFRQLIEEAKPLPMRTEAIIKIILEEAEDYFNGYKNPEEVSGVVNNRVQLYLDENL